MDLKAKELAKSALGRNVLLAGLLLWLLLTPAVRSLWQWPFEYLELQTLTLRQAMFVNQHMREGHQSPVVLLTVDRETISSPKMRRIFGWADKNRAIYAYAIRFLERSNPQKIIFDVSFDGGDFSGLNNGDQAMAQSLAGTGNVASGLAFSKTALDPRMQNDVTSLLPFATPATGLTHLPPETSRALTMKTAIPPVDALLHTPMQFYSGQTIQRDSLGIVRRWTPITFFHGQVFPTLAMSAVMRPGNKLEFNEKGWLKWPGGKALIGRDLRPLIKWYGVQVSENPKERAYQEFHFWNAVESELVLECRENPAQAICHKAKLADQPPLSPEVFSGKIVLIDRNEETTGDRHQVFFGTYYPGVYILANAIDNLIRNDSVLPAPLWLNLLAAFLLLGLAGAICWRYKSIAISSAAILTLLIFYFALTSIGYNRYNLWINYVYPAIGTLVLFSASYTVRYLMVEKKRQQLRFAFAKYVSPAVMQNIEKSTNALQLGGQRRELTLLFCDIRGFTSFSENNPPEVVERFLLEYFSVMNGIIKNRYQGSISKLMGDAIMAYWGFPLEKQDHSYLAVCAALEMRDALMEWMKDPEKPPLRIGVGINTGEVMIGNIGSEDFMDFTVIGDAVNTASRLESLNKEYGSTIMISESTYALVKDRIECNPLGSVKVKGKEQEVAIYEPICLKTDALAVPPHQTNLINS